MIIVVTSTSLLRQRRDSRGTKTTLNSVLTPEPPLRSSRLMKEAMVSIRLSTGLTRNTTWAEVAGGSEGAARENMETTCTMRCYWSPDT